MFLGERHMECAYYFDFCRRCPIALKTSSPFKEMPSMQEPNEPEVETIELDQFLKLAEVTQSGGQAKHLIQSGGVLVNGMIETRRGKKLRPGDRIMVGGEEFIVGSDSDDEAAE